MTWDAPEYSELTGETTPFEAGAQSPYKAGLILELSGESLGPLPELVGSFMWPLAVTRVDGTRVQDCARQCARTGRYTLHRNESGEARRLP